MQTSVKENFRYNDTQMLQLENVRFSDMQISEYKTNVRHSDVRGRLYSLQ